MPETRARRRNSRDSDRHPSNGVCEKMRGNRLRSKSQTSTSDRSGHYQGMQSNDTSGYESMDAGIPRSPPPSYEAVVNPLFVNLPNEDEAYISSDSRRSTHCSRRSCRSYDNLPVCVVNFPSIETEEMTLKYTERNGDPSLPDIITVEPKRTGFTTKKLLVNGRMTEYESLPVTTPEQAKRLLIDSCRKKLTRSSKFAKKCHICEIKQCVAFRCRLSTYTEERRIVSKLEKYKGEKLDKPKGHVSSLKPWEISISTPKFFQNGRTTKKIPHTEELKTCQKCKGSGQCTCARCHGMRTSSCYRCHGNGTIYTMHAGKRNTESCGQCSGGHITCGYCRGLGHENCATCDGNGRLKQYKQLEVTWETITDTYLDNIDGVPENKLGKQSGHKIYRKRGEKLEPIKEEDVLHKKVRRFSKNTLENHVWPTKEILQQECTVDMIPVNVVRCVYKDTEYHFYVIGLNGKVYAPNYPGNAFGIASLFRKS